MKIKKCRKLHQTLSFYSNPEIKQLLNFARTCTEPIGQTKDVNSNQKSPSNPITNNGGRLLRYRNPRSPCTSAVTTTRVPRNPGNAKPVYLVRHETRHPRPYCDSAVTQRTHANTPTVPEYRGGIREPNDPETMTHQPRSPGQPKAGCSELARN